MALAARKKVKDVEVPEDAADTRRNVSRKLQDISYIRLGLVLGILIIIVLVVVLGIMRLAHGYWPWSSDEVRQQVLVEKTITAAGKLMILPESEAPLVATIVDAEALQQEQPFYRGAQDGDRLLIYGTSLRAILYSPDRDIIVNVGPIQVPQEAATSQDTPTAPDVPASASEVLTLDIRNGSGIDGVASTLAEELSDTATYSVASVTDAATSTYTGVLVIDRTVTNEKTALVDALVEELGATRTTIMPEEEVATAADVIILIGS